jgi:hypothetical protein
MAGKATVSEFAAAVRQEYPGKFDGVSDDELIHAVVQEKPELGAQVDLRTYKPSNVLRPKDDSLGAQIDEARAMGVGGRAKAVAVGAGKSLIRTPYNIYKGVANAVEGQPADTTRNADFEDALENKNLGESVGGAVADAAQFAGAEGAVNAGVKGVIGATKVPRLLSAIGRVAKGAIVGGSVAKAEGGSGTVGAIVGGAGPAAEELVSATAPALKSAAKKGMSRVLGATGKPNKIRSGQVVQELLDRGVTGSREAIAETAKAGQDAADEALDQAWAGKAGDKLNVSDITQKMDDAADQYKYVGPAKPVPVTVQSKAGPVVVGTQMQSATGVVTPTANRFIRTLDGLKQVLEDNADAQGQIESEKLRGIKKIWDKVVSQREGYAGANLSLADEAGVLAHRESANAIRSELSTEYPDIAKINKEYTFWSRVHRVVSDTLVRTSSQSQPMGEQLMKAAGYAGGFASGAAVGGSTGHGLVDRVKRGIVGGITGALLRKVTTSGKWGSVSAVAKDRLANEIAAGNVATVQELVHKLAFATGVQLTRDEAAADRRRGRPAVNETQGERIATLEERTREFGTWKAETNERLHGHSRLLTELRLWKDDRVKKDEVTQDKVEKLEKRLDAISLRFMLVWGTIGAVISVAMKMLIESAIKGHLTIH